MAELDDEDIMALYDTGVFNDIALEYAKKAMEIQKLPKGRRDDVLTVIRHLHDTMGAAEAVS